MRIHISYKAKDISKNPHIINTEIKKDIYEDLLFEERFQRLKRKIPSDALSKYIWYFSERNKKRTDKEYEDDSLEAIESMKKYMTEDEFLCSNEGKNYFENQVSMFWIMDKYRVVNIDILCDSCFKGKDCHKHWNTYRKLQPT